MTTATATRKGANNSNTIATRKPIASAQQTATPVKEVKKSDYALKVLDTNKALKEESAKLGYCIKQLEGIKLPTQFAAYLGKIRKDSNLYKQVESECRKSKSGRFTAFYLLQYLYKVTK